MFEKQTIEPATAAVTLKSYWQTSNGSATIYQLTRQPSRGNTHFNKKVLEQILKKKNRTKQQPKVIEAAVDKSSAAMTEIVQLSRWMTRRRKARISLKRCDYSVNKTRWHYATSPFTILLLIKGDRVEQSIATFSS